MTIAIKEEDYEKMDEDELNEKLIEGIINSSLFEVRNSLKNGADANYMTDSSHYEGFFEEPALSLSNSSKITQLLIDYGADVNAKDTNGLSSLMKTRFTEIGGILIENGADVNAKDNDGLTALMKTENIEIAEILIKNGADVNAKSSGLDPTIMISQSIDVIKLLIKSGADVNATDSEGGTVLMQNQSADTVKYLVENGANVNQKNNKGDSAYFFSKSIHARIALIESGFDVNTKSSGGFSAIMVSQDPKFTEFLIKNGADVNSTNATDTSVLMRNLSMYLYCDEEEEENRRDNVELLVQNGANVNYQRKTDGKTPLMLVECVSDAHFLITAGADLSIKDKDGKTAVNQDQLNFPRLIELRRYIENQSLLHSLKAVDQEMTKQKPVFKPRKRERL